MLAKVFVDTAAWLALINPDDSLHSQAIQVRMQLQKEKSRLVTTDFVFLEVADALSAVKLRSNTIAYINRLKQLASLQTLPINENTFEKGWQLYSQRLDKDWGLTDCISFTVMNQESITIAFTSDRHFEQAGFQRLLSP